MKESSLRQVSWLSVQRASPTFPDASSGWFEKLVGEALADYSCGGSPGFRTLRSGTGFPF
jgi:hypothetical protein